MKKKKKKKNFKINLKTSSIIKDDAIWRHTNVVRSNRHVSL